MVEGKLRVLESGMRGVRSAGCSSCLGFSGSRLFRPFFFFFFCWGGGGFFNVKFLNGVGRIMFGRPRSKATFHQEGRPAKNQNGVTMINLAGQGSKVLLRIAYELDCGGMLALKPEP